MRPGSEIHSAIDLLDSELSRQPTPQYKIARDVLAWVAGDAAPIDGQNAWLAAFLLDDPPRIDDTPTGSN
jgi:hypothetical protein